MRRLHVANSTGRDAVVVAAPTKSTLVTSQGLGGKPTVFRRYVAVGEGFTYEALAEKNGEDLSAKLIAEDIEIDFEKVGSFIEGTQQMLLTSEGQPMYTSPHIMEVTFDAAGNETGRKEPSDTAPTITDDFPLVWTGRKLPKKDVVRQFMFRRTMEIKHVDGVTFDFLFNMAKELQEADSMMLMGAGENGKEAIVLQMNGTAYRGFLEGRVSGDSFKLLLHLSNMELKKPEAKSEGAE